MHRISSRVSGNWRNIQRFEASVYFQLALNYGSRDEIRRGMQKMAQDVKDGKVEPDGITEDTIESYLDTAGVPDPDL